MTDPIKVALASPEGHIRMIVLEASDSPPWRLIFHDGDGPSKVFEGDDLFKALIGLRSDLERVGDLLLCAGARVDVLPSGMSRSMAGGRKAYVVEIGRPADPADIVDIFEPISLDQVASVADQQAFGKTWIEALKKVGR